MPTPIRLGFLGAGTMATIHLHHFSTIPEVEFAAIHDVRAELAEERATEFKIGVISKSADELIADASIDAVIIAVPNKWHASLAIAAMRAGKHVLLEKPMALDAADAKEIVRVQRETGRVVLIGHQMRWLWWALQARERIDRGDLGAIYYAKCGWLRRKGLPGWGTWFTQRALSGGGTLIDVAVHVLDLAMWLMGNPKPISVFGASYAEFGPEKRGIGSWGKPDWNGVFDVEDLATALIRFENGAMLSLEASWAANHDTDSQPFLHLLGHDGGISVQHGRYKFLAEHRGEPVDIDLEPPPEKENERDALARHFLDCVRGNAEPICSVSSGLANNLVLEGIYESSRRRREVVLDWSA